MKSRKYDDDDGRTIADMSAFSFSDTGRDNLEAGKKRNMNFFESLKAEASSEISSEGRRGAILGALAATLLIGLAFAVGIGIVILLITLIGC